MHRLGGEETVRVEVGVAVADAACIASATDDVATLERDIVNDPAGDFE